MTGWERTNVARVIDIFVAPVAPLPAVSKTDAVPALEHSLAAGPKVNALALRVALVLVGLGLRRGPLVKAVTSLAHLHYYGDAGVMRLLGYDAEAVIARASKVRAA